MASHLGAAFKQAANEGNYHDFKSWKQNGGQIPSHGNDRTPGLISAPAEMNLPPVRDHFTTASNQDPYSFAQQRFRVDPDGATAQTKTTDDQPGAYADPEDISEKYPGLPQSTDQGRVLDLEVPVTGSDGQTYMRSAKVYVPNDVAEKIKSDGLEGVDSIIGIHGMGGNAENTLDGMDLADLANKQGAILISPQALGQNDPGAPLSEDNPSHWQMDGPNDPAFFKTLQDATESKLKQEYGNYYNQDKFDRQLNDVSLVGMSNGANTARAIAGDSEKFLREGTQINTVTSVTASQEVTRESPGYENISGTQLYIFGMQDQKAAEKLLKDDNAKAAYLDSLTAREQNKFKRADDKAAYVLEHRGENDKVSELFMDDYMNTIQSAAAAQGVTLTREDIENSKENIYKPILDDKGNAILDADGKPTYDTNTILGTRYNIVAEQDGHKFKSEVNILNNMDHNWIHEGPSRMPGAIEDALSNDDNLKREYYNALTPDQRKEYSSLDVKKRLDYAINNDQDNILKGYVRKQDLEKYGIDPIDRANEIMSKDMAEKDEPTNDATLLAKPPGATPPPVASSDGQQSKPLQWLGFG